MQEDTGIFAKSSVKHLTGADFENVEPWILKDKKCSFVLFYADWCGHCQNLKPDYVKFSDIAQFIKVYAVNSDTCNNLLQRISDSKSPLDIKGYPTIWIYSNGIPIEEYTEDKSWQKLLAKAKKVCHEKCDC